MSPSCGSPYSSSPSTTLSRLSYLQSSLPLSYRFSMVNPNVGGRNQIPCKRKQHTVKQEEESNTPSDGHLIITATSHFPPWEWQSIVRNGIEGRICGISQYRAG